MSELPKGYAPFNPGPRYKPNPKQIDAQARAILNGGVEKGFLYPAPAHERAAEMRRARTILNGPVDKAFVYPATKSTSHKESKMSAADKAVRKAVAKSTRRSLDQQAARKAAASTFGAVTKAVVAPRLSRIAELQKMLRKARDDQERQAVGVLLGREELARDHQLAAMANLGLVSKSSPGVPLFATATPKASASDARFSQSGFGGPMTAGTRAPQAITTPGGESQAVGGSNTYNIPTESSITNPRDTLGSMNAPAKIIYDQLRAIRDGRGPRFTPPADMPSLVTNHQRDTRVRRDEIQNEIDDLQNQLDDAMTGKNADRASELGYRLTKAKLKQMHKQGDQYTVPIHGGR